MTNQSFNKGFSALSVAFPAMSFDAKIFWEMVNDLDGEFFLKAVWEFIKNTQDVFPGTNIIATIRNRTEELQNEAIKNNVLKLEAETEKERIERWAKEAVPMPDECKKELEKLGLLKY
jgi:hypothetical protein